MKKAVIPCGGLGTRFYPIASAVPKEMLPLFNRPVLHHIVLDMVASGIDDICFVISSDKECIKKYFTPSNAVVVTSRSKGMAAEADELERIYQAKFTFVYQDKPKGSGDAVLCAQEFCGDDPFLLSWGDDIIIGDNATKQILSAFDELKSTLIGVKYIATDDICKYGVVDVDMSYSNRDKAIHKCNTIVEKPTLDSIPLSRLASIGKYVLDYRIFDTLSSTRPIDASKEHLFTDALQALCSSGVYSVTLDGDRFDMGNADSVLRATIELHLQSLRQSGGNDYKEFLEYLQNIALLQQ